MTTPRVASWLLRRLLAGNRAEALIGDLTERYQAGRSCFWFWRQTIASIAQLAFDDVRRHKLLAVRAILCGSMAVILLRFLLYPLARSPIGDVVEILSGESRHIFFGTWAPLLTMIGAGWVVGRFHRGHAVPMVLTFAIVILLSNAPELERRVANALIDARYQPALRDLLLGNTMSIVGILAGGALSAIRLQRSAVPD